MEVRIADCPLGAKCEEVKTEDGRQVMYRCPWYTKLDGANPQNGAKIEEWGCAIAWTPILLVENAKVSMQAGAAIESFRNEMVKAQNVSNALQMEDRMRAGPPKPQPMKTISGEA
jgi:hypothetical protein